MYDEMSVFAGLVKMPQRAALVALIALLAITSSLAGPTPRDIGVDGGLSTSQCPAPTVSGCLVVGLLRSCIRRHIWRMPRFLEFDVPHYSRFRGATAGSCMLHAVPAHVSSLPASPCQLRVHCVHGDETSQIPSHPACMVSSCLPLLLCTSHANG